MIKQLLSLLFISYVTGTLYGLNNPTQLVTIDPKTATITNVGTVILDEIDAQQLSVIDERNKLYYFIGLNKTSNKPQLVSLALQDGHHISSVDLPFQESLFIGVGESIDVDPTSGVLYITGLDPQSDLHDILQYDPKSGKFTKLNEIGDITVMAGIHAFDPKNNLLWLSYGLPDDSIDLFAMDVSTGQWKYQNVSNSMNMESMIYDSQTGLMYGIGLTFDEQNHTRLLLTFNTVSLQWKEVGPIPGYFIIDADLGAIDEKNRKLFAVMQGNDENGPFQLLTIDMNTATVEDHPDVNYPDGFPWSIDFFND